MKKKEMHDALDRLFELNRGLFYELWEPDIKGKVILDRLLEKDPKLYYFLTSEHKDINQALVQSEWKEMGDAFKKEAGKFGVYRIRFADEEGNPISLPRIGGIDEEGVIYIGRSGYKEQQTERSIAQRIYEFEHERHSGEGTHYLMREYCKFLNSAPFFRRKLQYQVFYCGGTWYEVDSAEIECMAGYFLKFGELPPCNSKFDRKWKQFEPTLKRLARPG